MQEQNSFKYSQALQSFTYNFFLSALALVIFQATIFFFHRIPIPQGTAVGWTERVFYGMNKWLMLGFNLVILLAGFYFYLKEKKSGVPLHTKFFYFMLLEALVIALVFPIMLNLVIAKIFSMAGIGISAISISKCTNWFYCFGSGVYEELFFRFLLIMGIGKLIMMFTKNSKEVKPKSYYPMIFIAGLIFMISYKIPFIGEEFSPFIYAERYIYGCALGFLLVHRGFGILVWTHIFYDIFVQFLLYR